jgi:hypothetical protein
MQAYFANYRAVWRAGEVAGLSREEVAELIERCHPPVGTPILLDEQMRPIEPLSSWFRSLGLDARDADTMQTYAYVVLRLLRFLAKRGLDLASATETDLQEFRHWRMRTQKAPVQKTTMTKDKAAIKGLYGHLKKIGVVEESPWRSGGFGASTLKTRSRSAGSNGSRNSSEPMAAGRTSDMVPAPTGCARRSGRAGEG